MEDSSADSTTASNPVTYVREHRETLVRIIRHGDDPFVRGLALAALVEYGNEPTIQQVRAELDQFVEDTDE